MGLRSRLWWFAPVFLASWLLDQATKRIAAQWLRTAPPRSWWGDLFRLEYSENSGAFLSLGASLPESVRFWLLTVAIGVVMAGVVVYAFYARRITPRVLVGLALLAGGGLGNWFDRVVFDGYVIDFMNLGIGPHLRTGIFNVADLLIEAGAVVLVWDAYRGHAPGE
ncbi:MAG: signal peptidase II [Acidobacteriia bacterium]|nr:signal peptidase II [Terriglobia bacterium]